MSKFERVRYELLVRLRDFANAHRALFPESSTAGKAFALVAEAAARIETNAIAKPVATEGGRTTKVAAEAAVRLAMARIARTARGLAQPPLGGRYLLAMPRTRAQVGVLQAARRFVSVGGTVKDELVLLGLEPNALDALAAAADRYEAALRDRRANVTRALSTQQDIEAAFATAFEALRQLDVVVPNLLEHEPAVRVEWHAIRRLSSTGRKATAVGPQDTVASASPRGGGDAGNLTKAS